MARRKAPAVTLEYPPKGWINSAWQAEVMSATQDLARPSHIFMNAGRGAGKDIVAIRCVLRDALKWYARQKERQAQGGPQATLNPLVKVWVLAPQENNIKQIWEDWKGALRELAASWAPIAGKDPSRHDWLFREVVRKGQIILFGDGQIEIERRLTSTRDALRGPGVDLVHWTEFATETSTGELDRAFRGELPGTLTRAGRLGRVYATTTPKGPMGGFWDEMVHRFGGEGFSRVTEGTLLSEDGLNLYVHTTSYQNDFLTPEQLQQIDAEKASGWFYEQERLAKFVIGEAGGEKAFSRSIVEKCLVPSTPKREGFRQIIFGVDIARFGEDETSYVGTDESSGDIVRVEFHKGRTGQDVVDDLKRLYTEFPGCQFVVDSTGHRGYIADFAPSWLTITETQFSRQKEKWVGGLRMLLQTGRLRIPDPATHPDLAPEDVVAIRKLLAQLLSFLRVVRQNGGIDYRHPPGENDDGVDALIMSTMRLAKRMQDTLGTDATREAVGRLIM